MSSQLDVALQLKVFRVVEGAVRNTMHAHPKWKCDDRFPTSVAKRATGILTSKLGLELAAFATRRVGSKPLLEPPTCSITVPIMRKMGAGSRASRTHLA